MQPSSLTHHGLLRLWERCFPLSKSRRILEILTTAYAGTSESFWNETALGYVNLATWRFRNSLFGSDIHLFDRCPQCEEGVELKFGSDQLGSQRDGPIGESKRMIHNLRCNSWVVSFKLPTFADWNAAAAQQEDASSTARDFLGRGIISAKKGRRSETADSIPDDIWEALAAAVIQHDPWSEILLNLTCPRCANVWNALFEPGDYLWREINAAARALFYQVHRIASCYGWSEGEILNLTPERRATYITMIDDTYAGDRGAVQRTSIRNMVHPT